MAHLRELSCGLDLPPPERPLIFPAALRELNVHLPGPADAAQINACIATISRLPLLEELTVALQSVEQILQVSFAPLAASQQLRGLFIPRAERSDAQIDQLRALPHLQELNVRMSTPLLRRLLRQPHDLRWQQISLPFRLDDETATLLPQLPSLTRIDGRSTCDRFDWLRGLPSLTDVHLSFDRPMRAAALVAGLQSCAQLRLLSLSGCRELTAAQLTDLLPRLPRLRELRLSFLPIDSLAFLAQPPLTSQLADLYLWSCEGLPPGELRHVHALLGLEKLELCLSFTVPLGAHDCALLTPPSILLPQLKEFVYQAP